MSKEKENCRCKACRSISRSFLAIFLAPTGCIPLRSRARTFFFFFVRFTKFYRSGVYSLVARVCPSKAAVASQPRDSSVQLPGPWIRPMCCRRSPDVLPGRDSASWSSCGGIPRLEQKRPRWDLLALPWGRCFPLACAAVGERVFDSQFLWHQARYEEVALFDRSARVNLFFRYNKG